MHTHIHAHTNTRTHTAPEASWRQVFDPYAPLLFNLYHHLEQKGYFGLVPEYARGPGRAAMERFCAQLPRAHWSGPELCG